MKRKFYFPILALALAATAVAFVVGHSVKSRAAAPLSAASALPASDFVVVIDAQRALGPTLSSVLADNPTLLAKINAKLDAFQKKTGIDPHSIESIAIGGQFGSANSGSHGVLIARGSFDSNTLIDAALTEAATKWQIQKEEQDYQGRKIFLVSGRPHQNVTGTAKPVPPPPPPPGGGFGPGVKKDSTRSDLEVLESKKVAAVNYKAGQLAVTALDANTVAVGDLQGVEAAIDASVGKNPVDSQLVSLATQTQDAVVGYSGKLPPNFSEKVTGSGNDPVGKYFASIREFYGSYSINGTDADSIVTLRTETADQARDISQAINGLKTLAAIGLSQSSGNNSAQTNALATALQGLVVTAQDNEVRIEMKIPQASLAPLIHLH